MDADDVKHLHVIVQDKGKPIEVHGLLIPNNTSLQELQERVEETILGPAEHRWEIISEERLDDINPLTGGGTIQVTSLLKSRVLKLFTHPHAACAPVIGVEPHELPPSVDLYRLMMRHSFPVPSPLLQELDIQRWWSQVPVSRVDLRAQLMKRLVEKMTVGQPAASRTQSMSRASRQGSSGSIQSFRSVNSSGGMGKTANRRSSRQLVDVIPEEGEEEVGEEEEDHLQEGSVGCVEEKDALVEERQEERNARKAVQDRLMLEGVQGIWELSCDRSHANQVSLDMLHALLEALRNGPPAVQVMAMAATWNLCVVADVRLALVQLGLVELLVEVLEQQVAWRTSCTEALVSQVLEVQAWQQRELGRRAMKTMTSNLTPSKKDSPPEETDVSNTVTREGPAISGGPQGDSTAADPGLVGEEAPPSAELLPVLQMRNHVVFHALGALAVLAVDADARLRWIKMSPGLDMLVRLCSLEFPVPPAPLPDLPTSPTDADPLAEELSDDQPLLDTIAATATEESLAAAHTLPNPTSAAAPLPLSSPTASTATTQNTRHKSTSSSRPQSAAMVSSSDGAGVLSEETPLNPKESLPKALSWREDMDEEEPPPNEDLPETQQKMAAEVMYSMLGRDRNVRQAFVFAGGVAKVLHLLESRNADVRYCSVLAVAAYSLDMDRDHVTGLSMLRSSDLTEQLIEALLPVAEEVVVMLHGYSSGLAPQLQSASSGPGHQDQDHGFNEFKTAVAAGDGIEDATSIGSGVHPLLSLLEGAGAAIRGCVVAHITGAGITSPSMVSLRNVSRLARLAELLGHQLQELLKQSMASEENESWPPLKSQKPSPATRLNPSSSSDSPQLDAREGQQAKIPSYTTVSNEPVIRVDLQNVILPQIRTLYCLMSCLVTVQTGPGFLSTALQRLQSLLSLISEQEADLEDKLEVLRQEHINAAKRRTASSISFHFEDSTSEEAGPEAAVEEAERTLAASQSELVDLKEDLQAASEDCIVAALESMGLPILKHPSWVSELGDQLGHVQLMALGLALAMVEARHPHEHTTGGQKPDTLFQGPFRQLLLDSQVIQAVIKVASSPSLDACEPKLGRDTRMVASAALGHLFAVQVPLPAEQDIKAVLQYMVKVHQHHDCSPHLASALWCLARHELNRRVILTSHEWINLCTYWSDCCLEDLKRASSPSEVHRHSAAATAAASAPSSIPMLRCCMMTTWMLLKQWLLDHASHVSAMQASGAASTDAVYLRSETSWWAVKFDVSVPLRGPPLDQPGSVAGGGLGMLLHLAAQAAERGMPRNLPLWDMALRCCWSLATSHPSVSSHLIKLGVDRLLVHYCTSQRAASPLVCVAVKYLTFLMTSSSGLEALGGPARVCKILVVVLDRAMAGSDEAGRGADVPLLELAVRGLASAALLGPVGRQAVLDARGVRRLIEVVRADNRALEQVMSARMHHNVPKYESPQELFCPLRSINGLPHQLGPAQATAAAELEAKRPPSPPPSPLLETSTHSVGEAGSTLSDMRQQSLRSDVMDNGPHPHNDSFRRHRSEEIPVGSTEREPKRVSSFDDGSRDNGSAGQGGNSSHSDTDVEDTEVGSGDADVGLMAIWGLLNMSGFTSAQVPLCRYGLYTLLSTVHRSMDPHRKSASAAILNNIHFHPGNVTVLYRAELRLKQAALTQLEGIDRKPAKLHVGHPFSPKRHGMNPTTISFHTKSMVRTKISSSVGAAVQLEAQAERDDPQRKAAEANVAFLKCLVDPETFAPGLVPAPAELQTNFTAQNKARLSTSGSAQEREIAAVTDDLMERLTTDPEEMRYLAHLRAVSQFEGFSDARHQQGSFLRASLARSLAEGAHSLWGGRAAAEGRDATRSTAVSTAAVGQGKGRERRRQTMEMPAGSPAAIVQALSKARPRTAPASGQSVRPSSAHPQGSSSSAHPQGSSSSAHPQGSSSPNAGLPSNSRKSILGRHITSSGSRNSNTTHLLSATNSKRSLAEKLQPKQKTVRSNLSPTARTSPGHILRGDSLQSVSAKETKAQALCPTSALRRAAAQSSPTTGGAQRPSSAAQHRGSCLQLGSSTVTRLGSAEHPHPSLQHRNRMNRNTTSQSFQQGQRMLSPLHSPVASSKEGHSLQRPKSLEGVQFNDCSPRSSLGRHPHSEGIWSVEDNAKMRGSPNFKSRTIKPQVSSKASRTVNDSTTAAETVAAVRPRSAPRPLAATGPWAPHILSYLQDRRYNHPRTSVAQKLMTVSLPVVTAEGLAEVSSRLIQQAASTILGQSASETSNLAPVPEGEDEGEGEAGSKGALQKAQLMLEDDDGEADTFVNVDEPQYFEEDEEEIAELRAREEIQAREKAAAHMDSDSPAEISRTEKSPPSSRPWSAGPSGYSSMRPFSARRPGSFVAGSLVPTSLEGEEEEEEEEKEGLRKKMDPSTNATASAQAVMTVGLNRLTRISMGDVRQNPIGDVQDPALTAAEVGGEISVTLRRPSSGYKKPHQGLVSAESSALRPQTAHGRRPGPVAMIKALHARMLVEAAAAAAGEEPPPITDPVMLMRVGSSMPPAHISELVPRPTTVVGAELDSLLELKQLRDKKEEERLHDKEVKSGPNLALAGMENSALKEVERAIQEAHQRLSKPTPLAMVVATGDGGPEKTYQFPRDISRNIRNLCLFEHVEGCRVCEELYGHYLLPSGRLAHFYVGDTVRKGHRVDLVQPPDVPFQVEEWLPDGLPMNRTLADLPRHLLRSDGLLAPLWCPVPELGPETAPGTHILEWEPGKEGHVLQLRTVMIVAKVEWIRRQDVATEVVPPRPKKGKKKKR